MFTEIERKFLVTGNDWREHSRATRIIQGYLCFDSERTVRVRIADDQAWLTVKGRRRGITRREIEFPIPIEHARELMNLCDGQPIEKTRHTVEIDGFTWEIDEFHGINEGLVVAEIELPDETTPVRLPPWCGIEVSYDRRYSNSSLVRTPYPTWPSHVTNNPPGFFL